VAPSEQVKTHQFPKKSHEVSPYCHWFSLALLKLWEYLQGLSEIPSMVTVAGTNFDIDLQLLHTTAHGIEQALTFGGGNIKGCNLQAWSHYEIAMTTYVARVFDRFLFSDTTEGCCLHQAPVGIKTTTPFVCDLYVAKMDDNQTPGDIVLLGEAKVYELTDSQIQTVSSSIAVMGKPINQEDFRMHLGLPYTRFEAQLELHVEVNNGTWTIPIAKSVLKDPKLLTLVYVGVHYLLKSSIYVRPALRKSLPFQDWLNRQYTVHGACDYYSDDGVNTGHVFCYGDTVYKFFDSKNKHLKPNDELIRAIGENGNPYLEDFTVEKVCYDEKDYSCRFTLVKYKCLKGNHQPKSVEHFVPILLALQKIHDEGYVHGDIRLCNLIFNEDGLNSWIIDFDMASKGGRYSSNYNCSGDIKERYSKDMGTKEMKPEHDRHSLGYLMRDLDKDQRFHKEIKDIMCTKQNLSDIADEIRRRL